MQLTDFKDASGIPWQGNRSLTKKLASWAAGIFLLLLLAVPANAQYRTSIQGTVLDPQGAVISGATLTLTDESTNEKVVRTSNEEGVFNFNALPADHFNLVIERTGFEKKVLHDLQLIPEQANALNVKLEVGAETQTVTVSATAESALDTETANNGRTISEDEVQHMPTFQRDATGLTQLTPGTLSDGAQSGGGGGFAAPGTQSGASHGGGGNMGSSSSIFATENGPSANTNGGQFQANGFTVDGVSTVSAVWGGSTIITPSEDSISNIRVVTNAYDAENARFTGALTEITSKSGSNQFHGGFVAQIVRPGLNAYQRWNGAASNSPGTPAQRGLQRDNDRYNQFGGNIGGPIWKNKVFAFFNYEGQSQNAISTNTAWLVTPALTALAPANSIAHTYLSYKGASVNGTQITGATCATAGIPSAYCANVSGGLNIGSPLTAALGTQDFGYVNATTPGNGNGLSTVADIAEYNVNDPSNSDFKQYNGRLDADATANDHLSFSMFWVPDSKTWNNGGYNYDLFHHSQVNNSFALIWNHTFSSTFLNEARANAAGWRYNELSSNPQAPFGLPQDSVSAIGNTSISSFSVGLPGIYDQWTYTYKDVATKVLSRQTMKFGFDWTRLYYLQASSGAPNYGFFNLWDFMNDAPDSEGGAFQGSTGIPGYSRDDNRENLLGIFFQDDWKLRPNLTVNLGMRYSYFGPLTDKDDHMATLTFGSGASYLTGMSLKTGVGSWNAQKGNFGPQLGFNWSPDYFKSRMVVRGGFGLNYNQFQIANSNNEDGNPAPTGMFGWGSAYANSPKNVDPHIKYAVSSSPTNVYGYPANPYAITTFNAAGLPTAGGAGLGALPNNLKTQYAEHYSLEVAYDLGHSLVANLGYEGSTARHLIDVYDSQMVGVVSYGAALNPLVNGITTFGGNGRSNNNMMLAGLKHQFSQHFTAEGQFTWAHSEDTGSGPYERVYYPNNIKLNYGRSDFDINKSFKMFGTWEPVIFHGSNNWMEKVAGGWALSGIMTLHSGFGWTPSFYPNHNFYCNQCDQWGAPALLPRYLGTGGKSTSNAAFKNGTNFASPGAISTGANNNLFSDSYFSIADFSADITDAPGQTNTAMPAPGMSRNGMPGPGYRNVDLNIGKAFGLPNMRVLGENAKFEIKADILNAFNILNINPGSINTNIANPGLGQANSALGSRTVDFQAHFSF